MLKNEWSGLTKVFRNERESKNGSTYYTYATSLGKKNPDGNWDNAYINLQFRKGADLPDAQMFDIDIQSAFLSFDKVANGDKVSTYWKLVVMEFGTAGDMPRGSSPDYSESFMAVDDDCPF